jgi:signal transduction histidine kinase
MNDIYVDPSMRKHLVEVLRRDGVVRDAEVKLRRRDGKIVDALLNLDWVEMEGQRYIFTTGRDITERKKAQTDIETAFKELKDTQVELVQSEKMAALGRFSTGIAHEVKNPLGIILGGAEFLESKLPKGDADAEMVLKKIKEAALRANEILITVLQYAKPSSLKIEHFMLNDLVVEVSSLFKLHPSLIRVETKIELSEKNPCIYGDKNQLQQALFNIVKNSMEAMPEGGTVTVRVGIDKDSVFIDVIDDGTGMPKEVRERLFEPFFTTKAGTGTGLGLFVVKTIIDNHKGRLIVESEAGKGTCFRVMLPLAK